MKRLSPLLILLTIACEDDPAPPDPSREAPPAPAPELARAAGIEPPTSAWPSDAADLLASLDAAESVESCRSRLRERIPVEVAEAMADLAYDQVLDDVCAGLVAVRDRSVEGCDALSVSAVRRGCRRRLALVAGTPDACPDDPTIPGREPVCVAWAARDPALCRAASPPDRPRCRAVLGGDHEPCARLLPGDRQRCEAEVRRYATALGEERAESAARDVAPRFRLTAEVVEADGSTREPIEITRDVLDRGVHLAARGCGHRLSLRDPAGELPAPVSFTDRPPTAELELDLPARVETPHEVRLGPMTAALRVVLPGVGEASSIADARGEVTITEWSAERGGVVAGEIDGELAMAPGRVRVRGEFRTFVRDVDRPDCPGAR